MVEPYTQRETCTEEQSHDGTYRGDKHMKSVGQTGHWRYTEGHSERVEPISILSDDHMMYPLRCRFATIKKKFFIC